MSQPSPLVLLLTAGLLALPLSAHAERSLGQLHFQPCTLASELGGQALDAQCTTLSVPENRAAANGRKISLAIAWLPATGEAEPDPVFLIAGGPGQSALESFPALVGVLSDVHKKRGLILVDQRGTGGSNKLTCGEAAGTPSEQDLRDPTTLKAFAARCAQSLAP